MNFKEYQELSLRSVGTFPEEEREKWILISALGLAGEAGEVSDLLKKVYGHGHKLDLEKLKKELGDTLWYISDLCSKFSISFEEVAQLNINKLKARYPEGFKPEHSQNRKPGDI